MVWKFVSVPPSQRFNHVRRIARFRIVTDRFPGLFFRAYEEERPADARKTGSCFCRGVQHRLRLHQVDDMDVVPLHEDVFLHLRIPAGREVPEMRTCFKELLDADLVSGFLSGFRGFLRGCSGLGDGRCGCRFAHE